MTFLNALLAFGALAFSIPLIIHLLHKSRFRTVDWGAMHLLENVVRINRRRMQISNLLLLLLRCLVPVILAFCLARPVLTGFKSLPGDAPESLVLVLDDSRSMSAGKFGEPSRIEKAKSGLTEMLRQMSRRDEVMLVRSSNIDAPAATMGVKEAIRQLSELNANGGPVDLGRLLDVGAEAATQASNQQRRILVVSDFQTKMLSSGAVQTLDRLAANFAEQESAPVIAFWDFDQEESELPNVSVDAVTIDSPAVVAGRSTQYSVRIQNASDVPATDLRVVWSVNGRPLEPRTITAAPRSTVTSRLNHVLDEPGVYEITVSVEHGDCLLEDNRRSISVHAMREINVLLVDGQPSNDPLEGEADFLAIALSPFAFGGDDQPDSVRTTTKRISSVRNELSKSTPEIIVLANVRTIRDSERASLANFVLQGGSLIVFDGDQINVDVYNETWTCEQGSLRMPAVMGETMGSLQPSEDEAVMQIGDVNPNFSAWDLLESEDSRPLGEVDVRAYRKLSIEEDNFDLEGKPIDTENSSVVLLQMSSGDPLAVSAKRGRGQVIQFAIPCNHAWSTLPLRPIYLPMMQQLVLDLAGKSKSQANEIGLPMSIPLSEFDAVARDTESDQSSGNVDKTTFTVELPNGDEVAATATTGDSASLTWTQTLAPGTYRFRRVQTAKGREPTTTTTIRIADVPPSESRLQKMDGDRLSAAAKTVDATVYSELSDLQGDDRTRRFGREIWRWLLVALLVFLVGELFVQQRLVRSTLPKGGL